MKDEGMGVGRERGRMFWGLGFVRESWSWDEDRDGAFLFPGKEGVFFVRTEKKER